jgi:hypothetical protein
MKLLAGSMKAVDETGETIVRAASTNTVLILRSALFARVSKDGGTLREPGLMVRDGANAPPHHEGL